MYGAGMKWLNQSVHTQSWCEGILIGMVPTVEIVCADGSTGCCWYLQGGDKGEGGGGC